LQKIRLYSTIGIFVALAIWSPIAFTGLPRTATFALRIVNYVDAGVVAYQPWTDQYGYVHPYQEYGLMFVELNYSNMIDGYPVESYNFSNIANVVGVDWYFHTLFAKVENGNPVYEGGACCDPPLMDVLVHPFNGINFQATYSSLKHYEAEWDGNTFVDTSPFGGNGTGVFTGWSNADAGLGSQIEINASSVISQLPRSASVRVNFTAVWNVELNVSSAEAHLQGYEAGFDKSASLVMVVENGTVLSAAGTFYVHTTDTSPVSITYRTISLSNAVYATIGIVVIASIVLLVMFRKDLSNVARRIKGRGSEGESVPGSLENLDSHSAG
jgi:hypothetical protein